MIFSFSRRAFTGTEAWSRPAGIPQLSETQAEALDAVQFAAERNQLELVTQPGDLQFINNLAVLHSRQAFEDDGQSHRHLVRLWLRNDEMAWALPQPLQLAWDRVFADDVDREQRWALEPTPITRPPLRWKNSCE